MPLVRWDDDRGAILPMVAAMLVMLLTAAAFAVDLGMQRVVASDAQAIADVVALDMARLLDGRTAAELAPGDPASMWNQTLAASAARNDDHLGRLDDVVAVPGTADPLTGFFTPAVGGTVPTAVQVSVSGSVGFAFAPVGGGPDRGGATRSAVAEASPSACFRLGSFALGVQTGEGVLGQILGDMLGVTAVGYEGLALATVRLGDLLDALADDGVDLGVGTPQDLITADLTLLQLVQATATVLQRQGDPASLAAATVLGQVQAGLGNVTLQLGQLLALGTAGQAALDADVNVLDLLTAAAAVANGSQSVTVPALALAVPGLGTLQTALSVTEAPVIACGSGVADTGQVSLSLTGSLSTNLASDPIGTLCAVNAVQTAGGLLDLLQVLNLPSLLGPLVDNVIVGNLCGQLGADGCTTLRVAVVGNWRVCGSDAGGCREYQLRAAGFLAPRVAVRICLGALTEIAGPLLDVGIDVDLAVRAATAKGVLVPPPAGIDCTLRTAQGAPHQITVDVFDKQVATLDLQLDVRVLGTPLPLIATSTTSGADARRFFTIPTPDTYVNGYTDPIDTGQGSLGLQDTTLTVAPGILPGLGVSDAAVNQLLAGLVEQINNWLVGSGDGQLGAADRLGLTIAGADLWGVERPICAHPSLIG